MSKVQLCGVLFIYFIRVGVCESVIGLEVIPQRAEITYKNDQYVVNTSVSVRRFTRRARYMINLSAFIKHTWDNNVTVGIILYEYLHNEYKRSFVDVKLKLCDWINKSQLVGAALREHGIKCPLQPGYNSLSNATFAWPAFHYVLPFEKCKAEIILTSEPSHDTMCKIDFYILAKQVRLNKMKP